MYRKILSKIKLGFIPCQGNEYRSKFLEATFYLVIFLLVLKIFSIPFLIYFPKSSLFADITKTALINLVNQERESLGLQTLNENIILNQAAYLKAEDMMENDYFSHQSPEGFSPWYWFKKVGYDYKLAGENLAIGFLDSEEVHQAWLDSFSHKDNLLNPNYQEIGIGVVKGDFQNNETTVVVQLLGAPQAPIVSLTQEEGIEEGEILPQEELSSPVQETEVKDATALSFFRFIYSGYDDLIQKISYGLLILMIISLMITTLVKPDVSLVLRTIIFIVLLSFSIILDKETIIQLIPHSFIIYGL